MFSRIIICVDGALIRGSISETNVVTREELANSTLHSFGSAMLKVLAFQFSLFGTVSCTLATSNIMKCGRRGWLVDLPKWVRFVAFNVS